MKHHPTPRVGLSAMLALLSLGAETRAQAPAAHDNAWAARRPLGRDLPANRGESTENTPLNRAPAQHEPAGSLTLQLALEWALLHSPELAAASHGVSAAAGLAQQAAAFPNPELELDAGEFGGTGTRQGFDAAETSLLLSQSVDLSGKRIQRHRLAQSQARLAGWEYEAKRLEVLTRTKKAFVEVLLAQGQLALSESQLVLAKDVHKAATERVKAGKVPPLEQTQAGVEVAIAQIARDRRAREMDSARKHLALSWGERGPAFNTADGDLDTVGNVPPLETLLALLDNMPEVARGNEEMELAKGSLALAYAERLPDITIRAGMSRFEEDGTYAGTVGLSVPLPVFDRQAGGIASAKHQASRAEYDRRAVRRRATADLVEACGRLESTRAEALTTKAELLPGAQQAFDAAQTGFREGKYGHLEVLSAQRTLNETKTRYLDVLADYHKAVADVEQLTGTPLNTIQ